MNENTIIKACHLSKHVPGSTTDYILKDINLSIEEGSRVIITGPSGCGKTTLLHLLAGLDSPSDGDVSCFGMNWKHIRPSVSTKVRNQDMGFVFQFHHLLDGMTVRDNLLLPLLIAGVTVNDTTALDMMKKLALPAHKLNQPITVLSGGEKQRVALGRAIIHQPKLVFLDEPTGCLDTVNAKSLWQLLAQLQDEYALTLIVVTHDRQLIDQDSRVIEMLDGQIHL